MPLPPCSLLVWVIAVSPISVSATIISSMETNVNIAFPSCAYDSIATRSRQEDREFDRPNLSHMESLPRPLEQKRRAISRMLRRPVVVRGVRTPDAGLRGRLTVQPDRVIIEYQLAQAGYFWHIPIIEELLDRAASGEAKAEVREPAPASEPQPPAQ